MPESESQSPVDTLLDRRLRELPREIAPERDLWPSIERDIQRPQRRLLPIAVAAGIAVISIALVLNFNLRPTEEKWAAVPPGDKSLGWTQQTAELQQMKVGLQPALEQQLTLLDPETRRVVLENLAIIEQARNNITDALQIRPQSAVLSNQYLQLWQQEMAIYRRVSSYSYKM